MKAISSISNGRTVIPAALRERLGLRDGDELIWEEYEGRLLVSTRVTQLRRAQALVQRCIGSEVSLSDELLADRRREQADDEAK